MTEKEKTHVVRSWGAYGDNNGEMKWPACICRGANGLLYVTDSWNHRVQVFRPEDGHYVRKWGGEGNDDGNFGYPVGIAIAKCEKQERALVKALIVISVFQAFPPGLLPLCVAYVGHERVCVADSESCRVQSFESDGTFVSQWKDATQTNVTNISRYCGGDHHGTIYVTDSDIGTARNRILVFDANNDILVPHLEMDCKEFVHTISIFNDTVWYAMGNVIGYFCRLAHGDYVPNTKYISLDTRTCDVKQILVSNLRANIDNDGSCYEDTKDNAVIYITTKYDHGLWKFLSNGTLIGRLEIFEPNGHTFISPRGLAQESNGMLYVVDSGNHRIVALLA